MPDHDLPDRNRSHGSERDELSDPATELLLAAFDQHVRTQPVDEQRLITGTRTRLRRRRRVRRVQVAAVVLVLAAAVPATVQAWPTLTGTSTVSTAPIGQRPSPDPSSDSITAQPTPTAGQDGLSIAVVAYDIPDLTRARSTLPGGQTLSSIGGVAEQRRIETPLAGPVGCSGGSADMLSVADYSVAGREFQWADQTSPQHVITLTVTGWPRSAGAATFQAATSGSLTCAMTGDLTPVDLTIPGADQSWVVTADLGGLSSYLTGSARVGDLIVSASLPAATIEAAAARSDELLALLTAAVEDLRASDLPSAQGE